ncbi:MAG: restriction endonuclease [Pirellulales bacterium]|nr:restriction endonuclease [Pirellulales bacterium]
MASKIVKAISLSGLTIYDPLDSQPELYIATRSLERLLNQALVGLSLNFPIRTRSKVLKSSVCKSLGYPVPQSFQKTKPRFPAQNFDTYVQKSNNLQIWNEEVVPSRRYVLIRVDDNQLVTRVKVVTGDVIAKLDPTGTLTTKYQARSRRPVTESCLVSTTDATQVAKKLPKAMLPIRKLYKSLQNLIGSTIVNPGVDQERIRGAVLHRVVCKCLKTSCVDCGQFPDVPDQLLEIKLQTASTIDLGLVCPDSQEKIANLQNIRHCNVRYAVFYGTLVPEGVRLDHLIVTTGRDFFTFFRRFEGNVRNQKLQIPLPAGFFD